MKIVKKQTTRDPEYYPVRSILDDFFGFPTMMDDYFPRSMEVSNLFADVWEEDESIIINMAMPGLSKDDIDITITSDMVTIKGSKKTEEKKDDKKRYYFRSLESSFQQTFNLPTTVDANSSEAEYEDGVLKLKLPKSEESKPKQLSVK